jgi:hypothetical protein
MFFHTNKDAFQQLRPWIPGNLGHIQKQHWDNISNYTFTLSTWLNKINPLSMFISLILTPFISAILRAVTDAEKIDIITEF